MSARYLPDGSCEYVDDIEGGRTAWPSSEVWAKAWLAEQRADSTGPAGDFIDDMTRYASAGVVSALVVLARVASRHPEQFRWVGAGPIEDLVAHCGHGESTIDEVESAAAAEPEFRAAFADVWVGERVQGEIRRRLVTLGARNLSGRAEAP